MLDINNYSDIHRAILQTLMSRGAIEKNLLNNIFGKVVEKFHLNILITDGDLKRVIDKINEVILQFDQQIKKYQFGLDKKEYYIFISLTTESTIKLQNFLKEQDAEYFRLLLLKILEDEELYISPREALNLQSEFAGKLSKTRAEKLIDKWINGGYFAKKDSKIYLGPRSLVEFKENIQSMEARYLKNCMLCEEIAAWGTPCEHCKTAIFHKKCITNYHKESETYPCCQGKRSTAMEH